MELNSLLNKPEDWDTNRTGAAKVRFGVTHAKVSVTLRIVGP